MKWLSKLWQALRDFAEYPKVMHYIVASVTAENERIAYLYRLLDEQKAEIAELKRRKKKFSHLEPGLQATVNELLRLGA